MKYKRMILLILFYWSSIGYTAACQTPEYQQFDFWLGHWRVSNPQNNQISESIISSINNGCTILEEYSTPSGYQGKSLNIYDASSKKWHQTWTDNTGLLLQLSGHFDGTSMILQGITKAATGQEVLNRITWTATHKNTVNQHWQTSQDHGKSWQTAFNGTYIRAE